MKKTQSLLIIVAIVFLLVLTSFRYYQIVPNAVVEKINGIEVYCYSIPVKEYEVVGSGITNVIMGRCDGFATRSADKAAKLKADAVILHYESFKYEAIKWK